MKCNKCGFIFNGEKDTCPYCGTKIKDNDFNFLHSSTSLSPNINIKNIFILSILLINLFAISFFVDWALGFTYKLTLISYTLFMGLFVTFILMYKRRTSLSIVLWVDLYLTFLVFFAALFGKFQSVDLTGLFSGVILPSYIMFSSFAIIVVFFLSKEKTFSPAGLVTCLVFKLCVGITLFVLGMVYAKSNGAKLSFFDLTNIIPGVDSALIVKTLCLGAFSVSLLMFINSIAFLVFKVINNIRKFYGSKE